MSFLNAWAGSPHAPSRVGQAPLPGSLRLTGCFGFCSIQSKPQKCHMAPEDVSLQGVLVCSTVVMAGRGRRAAPTPAPERPG